MRQVNASGADILFVAQNSPLQEFWIAEHRETLDAPFCMGVGGTFEVVSGKAFFRQTGTEWQYRPLSDPRRWPRQLVLPKFARLVLKAKLFGGRQRCVPRRSVSDGTGQA